MYALSRIIECEIFAPLDFPELGGHRFPTLFDNKKSKHEIKNITKRENHCLCNFPINFGCILLPGKRLEVQRCKNLTINCYHRPLACDFFDLRGLFDGQ